MMLGMTRLFVCLFAFVLPAAALTQPSAQAGDYPARPIVLIAPWPPGGAVDTLCRILAARLSDRLGKAAVVVENRPGAASVLGLAAAARALPDGYTLAMGGSASLATSVTIYKKLPYDPTKDFSSIAFIARIPFLLVVHPSLPLHSVREFIEFAKQRPNELSYASGGPGSPHHLYTELLKSMTGIGMRHIPYKGSAPALADVVAGHVSLMFGDIVAAMPLVAEGKLRALGVSTLTRVPSVPEIPTVSEAGIEGFEGAGWVMIVAPANTPPDIVEKLYGEFKAIVAMPDMRANMLRLGIIALESPPPQEQQRFINAEIMRWAKVVDQAGLSGTE
jgi:tripartite-type tricarboxylate transporter receptor subunit TctC